MDDLKARSAHVISRLDAHEVMEEGEVTRLVEEIRAALAADPSSGRELGPLLAQVNAAEKKRRSAEEATDPLNWLEVGRGAVAVGHRPSHRSFPALKAQGVSAVVTLLSETEGAVELGRVVRSLDLQWGWFPMNTGRPPAPARDAESIAQLTTLLRVLDQRQRIFIHCSAGIHRTGMFTYALLRVAGWTPPDARAALGQLRTVTAEGVGDERLAWGDRLASKA